MKITLRATRTNSGLTIEEASKKLGVAFSTLQRWESRPWTVKAYRQSQLARFYGCSVSDILWGDEQEKEVDPNAVVEIH